MLGIVLLEDILHFIQNIKKQLLIIILLFYIIKEKFLFFKLSAKNVISSKIINTIMMFK